jgi:hypothetical protein
MQLERYIWAIRVLVKDAQLSPSTGTAPADVGVEQYTPLVQRPQTVENPLVKGVFMETFVTTVE